MTASRRAVVLNAGVALLLLGGGAASAVQQRVDAREKVEAERHRPIESGGYGYVSSRACRSCHPSQYASWHDSYHRTMTKPATPEYVEADIGERELRDGHFRVRLTREGGRYFFQNLAADSVDQTNASAIKHPLALVTGSHQMQVYWYETGEQRKLGQVPFAYLPNEHRFIPRRAAFLRPPRQMRPDEGGRWNTSCIACHTTQGRPRIDPHGGFETRVAELGIACEACHGPGLAHVQRNRSPLYRYARHLTRGSTLGLLRDDSIVNPAALDHQRASEICSQCHGIWLFKDTNAARDWTQHGFAYRPGGDPTATMFLLRPSHKAQDRRSARVLAGEPEYVLGQFWPDGMARVSGREFNGMIDSPCYARGELSCLSCHAMHREHGDTRSRKQWANDQLAVGMDGDRACTQCHRELTGAALARHTKHAPGSDGSRCYNCHMPYTSFGLLKSIRSHQISSPSVADTLKSGRPNACNLCHLDRSLGWTADALQRLWGVATPAGALDTDQRALASSLLRSLRGDAGQRALYAAALGWDAAQRASDTRFIAPVLGMLMDDPYDAVRFIAARSLHTLPGMRHFAFDPVPPPRARAKVAEQVAARAAAHGAEASAGANERVALRPDGRLREDVVARLQAQRDERPVHLLE